MEYLNAKKDHNKTEQYLFPDPYILPTCPRNITELYNVLLTVTVVNVAS